MNTKPSFIRFLTLVVLSILTGYSANIFAQDQLPDNIGFKTYWDQRRTHQESLSLQPSDIVMIGDDFIDRGMWAESYQNYKIKNRGIAGDNLAGLAYRVDEIVKERPSKMFIYIGKRDLALGMSPQAASDSLLKIVQDIKQKSKRTEISIISLIPNANSSAKNKSDLSTYNTLVEQKTKGLASFVDITEQMTDQNGLLRPEFSYNDITLNGRGYKAVVEALSPQLGKVRLDDTGIKEDYPLVGFIKERNSIIEYLPSQADDIIMIGNSITNGGEWAELMHDRRFKNRGISSDVTDGVLARLPHLLENYPQKVFLMIGVNDLGNNPNKSPQYTVDNILKIVQTIKKLSPRTQVFVQSILPVNPSFPSFKSHTSKGKEIAEVNKALRSASAKGSFTFIDLTNAFSDKDGNLKKEYTNDGLHLWGDGYIRWRDILKSYTK